MRHLIDDEELQKSSEKSPAKRTIQSSLQRSKSLIKVEDKKTRDVLAAINDKSGELQENSPNRDYENKHKDVNLKKDKRTYRFNPFLPF